MFYELYLDVYFLENLIMNCLVLYMAGRVQDKKIPPFRLLAAGTAGTALACIPIVLPVSGNGTLSVFCGLVSCLMMAVTGWGGSNLTRGIFIVAGMSLFLGGIWQFLRVTLSVPFWLAIPGGTFLASVFVRGWRRLKNRTQFIYDVVLKKGECTICLRGLLDSGNRLKQPGTARPVHIIGFNEAVKLLDESEIRELSGFLKMEPCRNVSGRFTYIPYHAIGDHEGVLPVFALDSISIKQGERAWSTKGALVAVSKEAVGGQGEYQMILHPCILE